MNAKVAADKAAQPAATGGEGARAESCGAVPMPAEPAVGSTQDFWSYLMSIPNVGEDADFERPVSYGRPEIEWE